MRDTYGEETGNIFLCVDVEVTWETARDWISNNSKESREELKRIKSERELREYLKDGTVLLRLLMHSKREEIDGVKHG